jgi:hypothetical protein
MTAKWDAIAKCVQMRIAPYLVIVEIFSFKDKFLPEEEIGVVKEILGEETQLIKLLIKPIVDVDYVLLY